jgi:hypothetical protein
MKRAEEDELASRTAAAPASPQRPPSAVSAGIWGTAAVGGSAASVASTVGPSWKPEREAASDKEPVVREFLQKLTLIGV